MRDEGLIITINKIQTWTQGAWLARHDDTEIEELAIDTRKIAQPQHALFIALKTNRRNGHDFIAGAYEKGVRSFLVDEDVIVSKYPASNFIHVKDCLTALQQIAAANRKQFNIPVIGITGSNGKTVVKEWLFQLLSKEFDIARSPKSYNSQIGVPLSVWLLQEDHQLGIFEAGISQPGEMDKLEKIIQPVIGVFTNIGEAHSEGFMNIRQKVNEKLVLFKNAQVVVYCRDYPDVHDSIAGYVSQMKGLSGTAPIQLFSWSYHHPTELRITDVAKEYGKTTIQAMFHNKTIEIVIPFTDPASIENAINCWCVMLLLGLDSDTIKKRMVELHAVSMRLELKHGINDCTIINDTYNSDLTSLHIAIDYLEQQKQHHQHTVILSDMLQIAKSDAELYEEVAELINNKGIQRFIGVGPVLYKHKAVFRRYKKLRSVFFKTTDDFLKNLHLISFNKEAILLKGARAFTFEKISTLLEQKVHQTVLSINLSSLTHNLNAYRATLQPGVKTMAMVKAFSYGSGSYEIAHLLQYSGVDYLSVAFIDEGISLRKAGITLPIMVMSPDANSFDRMIAWKLEPEIFSFTSLKAFKKIAATLNMEEYPIHVKLDTGMHRLGFIASEIGSLIAELKDSPQIKIASVFSHLAASENPVEDAFTQKQAEAFEEMSGKILNKLNYKPLRHIANSAAIARHSELHYDMVRLGLGLYGIDGSGKMQQELRQISTLKTTIAQVKTIEAGDTIGYGRQGYAKEQMRIATISIGYADGYPRALGNGHAHVLVRSKPAKIVGVICMDMCMIDVTDIPEATEGDEVVVFSPELPLSLLAQWADTIPYEIMTGISQRVKRVYENEM